MMKIFQEETECSGCGSCFQLCPHRAIEMRADEYGFVYPVINESKCTNCGLCRNVCPMKKEYVQNDVKPSSYALRHRDDSILKQSSSGGAFSAICQAFCEKSEGYKIFGVSLEDLQTKHIGVEDLQDLSKMRGSKYIQSDTGITFRDCRDALRSGKRVVFSGTPCQIAGLKNFLGNEDPQLLTIELICEGVQSQAFFDRYIAYMENKNSQKIQGCAFREKKRFGWMRSEFVLNFANTKQYRRICHTKDSAYMNSMLFCGGCRTSCYACPFASLPRQADFTIGDLWGVKDLYPSWNDNRGASLVLANTQKAMDLLRSITNYAELVPVDFTVAAKHNPNLIKPHKMPQDRARYLQDVRNLDFGNLQKKWLKPRSWIRTKISIIKGFLR